MQRVRIIIGTVAATSVAALIGNFLLFGVDIPSGILYLLSLIISAVFAPEAVASVTGILKPRAVNQQEDEQR